MNINGTSIIGFRAASASGDSSKAIDPSTGQAIEPPFYNVDATVVDEAATLAAQAFPIYSAKTNAERAAFLKEIADRIEGIGDELVARATQETGLPEMRIKGETGRTTGQLRLFASLIEEGSWSQARIDTAQPERAPLPKPDVRSMLRPLGPVVVFAASNFPLAFSTAGGDTASALAAGCPVIVKAHSSHPGTAELIAKAIQEAARQTGMPDGVFSLLFGSGRIVGSALVTHPAIKGVGFTGSTEGGTALMKLAGARPEPIPVYAEMGSVNPVVLLPRAVEARGDAIASGLHGSATLGVGQFCTNPGVVFVPAGSAGDALVASFASKMGETAAQVMLNPTIRDAYNEGVRTLSGNGRVKTLVADEGNADAPACLGATAVFEADAAAFSEDKTLSHEIFGPGATLIRWASEEELLRAINRLEGQLTGTIHESESDLEEFAALLPALERKVGRVVYNGFPTGVEVCHSMVHGGPFPATSDGRSTSVGTHAISRFARLVAFQDAPQSVLPDELKDGNPLGIVRLEDGKYLGGTS